MQLLSSKWKIDENSREIDGSIVPNAKAWRHVRSNRDAAAWHTLRWRLEIKIKTLFMPVRKRQGAFRGTFIVLLLLLLLPRCTEYSGRCCA